MNDSLLAAQLITRRKQLDQHIERLSVSENQHLYCRKGCADCCSLVVNCSFPEAAAMAHQLDTQQAQRVAAIAVQILALANSCRELKEFLRRYRSEIGSCVLLEPGSQGCSLYSQRPLTCRALLSTRPSAWCGVDFATLHPLEKEAFLSSLDRNIVNFPTHYLAAPQELAGEFEADLILSMKEHYGCGISGNLIYQIWLELEHELSAKLQGSHFDLAEYLNRHQLYHPLLLNIRQSS